MKEAQGWPREAGAFAKEQFKEWLGRAQSEGIRGDQLNQLAQQYWQNQMANGNGTPEDIWGVGSRVMPGVPDAINARRGRLNESAGDFDITHGRIGDRLNWQQDAARNVEGNNQSQLVEGYGRIGQRADASSGDIVRNIQASYGDASTLTGNGYTEMRNRATGAYGGMGASTDTAYGSAEKELEALKPGGELQAARIGRSFAPAMAATSRRLRASGVDPNSGEAFNMQSRVENSRARAMDDASAGATEGYVDRKTGMIIGRNRDQVGITERGLLNDQSLDRENIGIQRDLGLSQGKDFRGEVARTQGIKNQADQGYMDSNIANRNQGYERVAGADAALNQWDAGGYNTRAGLRDQQNAEDLTALGLSNEQFDRGMRYQNNDTSVRGQGAGMVTNMGQSAKQNQVQGANVARGFGGDASANYGQAWQYEAPNAGWATKALTGMAAGAMNTFMPGSGTALQGWGGQQQVNPKTPGWGGSGQYGGGWGGGYVWN